MQVHAQGCQESGWACGECKAHVHLLCAIATGGHSYPQGGPWVKGHVPVHQRVLDRAVAQPPLCGPMHRGSMLVVHVLIPCMASMLFAHRVIHGMLSKRQLTVYIHCFHLTFRSSSKVI